MKIQTFIFNWKGQYDKTKEKIKQLKKIKVAPVVINSDDNYTNIIVTGKQIGRAHV